MMTLNWQGQEVDIAAAVSERVRSTTGQLIVRLVQGNLGQGKGKP